VTDPSIIVPQSVPAGPAMATEPQFRDPAARWPWWMLPARTVGRFQRRIVAAAAGDALAINRHLPAAARLAVPLLVLTVAVVWTALHATGAFAYSLNNIEWLRLRVDHAFSEPSLLVILACVIGALSPAAGVLLVLAYGILDLGVSTTVYGELSPMPMALAGRLVALWTLWLLVVEIPIAGRMMAVSIRRLAGSRVVVAVIAALATGGLTWVWTQAAPVLLRPLYNWASLGTPGLSAIQALQTAGLVFACAAAAAAGVRAFGAAPDELIDVRAILALPPRPVHRRGVVIAQRLGGAAFLTVALGGLISGPLDAIVLFVAFAGAGPLAATIARRTPIGGVVGSLPLVAQAVLAAALAFGASIVMVGRIIPARVVSDYFSVIAAIAVGWFLVQLVISSRDAGAAPRPAGPAALGATLGLILLGISLLAPAVTLADNCASFADCWATALFAALAAAALPLLLALDSTDWLDRKLSDWGDERDRQGAKDTHARDSGVWNQGQSGAEVPSVPGYEKGKQS
jgi:hypothetical protein